MSRFLFPRSRWYARAEKLSGGERRRLQMLRVLARQPNVLLLDANPNPNPNLTLTLTLSDPNPNPNPNRCGCSTPSR